MTSLKRALLRIYAAQTYSKPTDAGGLRSVDPKRLYAF